MAKTYSPADVLVTIGGFPISGFAAGTFVSVEPNEDDVTLEIGADGEGTRTMSANRSAKVTLTLQQTSESNAILSDFRELDRMTKGGTFSVLIKDNLGASLYSAEVAWVAKRPTGEFADQASSREWVIETDRMDTYEGGN